MHEIHPLQIELTIAQLQASVMDLALVDRSAPGAPHYGTVINQAYETWRRELVEHEFVSA
jgi:hypothetical protein